MSVKTLGFLFVGLIAGLCRAHATVDGAIELWPDKAPGDTTTLAEEADLTKPTDDFIAGRRVIRVGNVSKPTITVYRPAPERNTGAAVVVCPGGGYHILALDLEGTEVCEWLNSIGVTAVLLKYRVPRRPDRPQYEPPLQDAQRALGLVRSHAQEWGVDPQRIGVLGFSAGGHLAAMVSTHFEQRTYEKIDAADEVSCRPDFSILIYPGYLSMKDKPWEVSPELTIATGKTPPTFLAMTEDDGVGVENPLAYYLALKKAKVPAEMHLYPVGGHGYGLRRTEKLVTTWPDRVADWMKSNGWLK